MSKKKKKKPVRGDPRTCEPKQPEQLSQSDDGWDQGTSFAQCNPHGSGGGLND